MFFSGICHSNKKTDEHSDELDPHHKGTGDASRDDDYGGDDVKDGDIIDDGDDNDITDHTEYHSWHSHLS